MAKGFKTGGRDFTPGHKFAKGRPRISEEEQVIREAVKKHLHDLLLLLSESETKFHAYLKSPECSTLARMLDKAIVKGDHMPWKDLFDRLLGKAPETIDITSSNSNVDFVLSDLPVEQREKIANAYIEKIRGEA